MVSVRSGLLMVIIASAHMLSADQAEAADMSIAGEYRCKSGCRLTDAAPSVEIVGAVAKCMNELGGTFSGKALSAKTIACFNKTGTLSEDGRNHLMERRRDLGSLNSCAASRVMIARFCKPRPTENLRGVLGELWPWSLIVFSFHA